MSTLPLSWFGPLPELANDERWVAHLAANRSQGKRAVGGALHITTRRLLFSPHALDARLGGKPWSCAQSEIASVGIERGRFSLRELFSGGLSDRLRLELRDGQSERFVVSRPEQLAEELRQLLRMPAPPAELPTARVLE